MNSSALNATRTVPNEKDIVMFTTSRVRTINALAGKKFAMHKPRPLPSLLQAATRRTLLVLGLVAGLSACMGVAGAAGAGGETWQEEVLLHDGQKMTVERWVSRGGRSEVGQQAAIQAQSLEFTHPTTHQRITWASQSSPDLRLADLTPIALQLVDTTPYLVAHPVGCQAYNQWGRPNPPYVLFRYVAPAWQRIDLQQLPLAIQKPNLIISSPDNEVQRLGTRNVSAAMVERVNGELTQPEFRSILREAMTQEQIIGMCGDMVLYKGRWVLRNDPVARKWIDREEQEKPKSTVSQ
jgi:hypothetical protein